jgi:hypothetical protein
VPDAESEERKPGREPVKTLKLDLVHAPEEIIGQKIDRYKILELVGEGCGVVYVAEHTEPVRRLVALKVIKHAIDTKQWLTTTKENGGWNRNGDASADRRSGI